MTRVTLSKFLAGRQIFTIAEAQTHLQIGKDNRTLKNLISYHLKKGHIIRIRRGIYYVVPAGTSPKECQVDPYLVCSQLAPDAILAYHTALAFWGKLHSIRNDFVYATQKKMKAPFIFQGFSYKGVSSPKNLARRHSLDFGVETLYYLSHQLRVTSIERTFVDILDRPALTGEWEEIWRSLEAIEYLDLNAVSAYALLLENASTIAKVGLFLELHREVLMVEEDHLKELLRHISQKPHYLDRRSKGAQQLVKQWNLIVPRALLEREWEEPYEDI
ncbi:MAG: type IV toxin-antitoxin system AbiEi family antitoxin domain-containing protein [Chlamydiales bacterium]